MNKLSRILVPVDFSAESTRALGRAADLAARKGAELHALHVQTLGRDMYGWSAIPDAMSLEQIIFEQARKDLEQAVTALPVPATHKVIRDLKAVNGIVRYAEAAASELIVMGTRPRKAVARLFAGSTTVDVVRQAPASVLVLGSGAESAVSPIRRVLAATDFSEPANLALQQAALIARDHGAALDVLHVVEPSLPMPYAILGDSGEQVQQQARAALDDLLSGIELPNETTRLVTAGPADGQIVATARKQGTDLIVMGTVGLSGIGRLLLGSSTERVLRYAPCAVLAHRGPVLG